MSLNKVNYVHGQTIISAQNMNDIQDEVIRLRENQIYLNNQMIIQPDYEQNDSAAIDYIKNRPFYNSTVYKQYPRYPLENPKFVTYTDITSSGYYQLLNGQYGTDISDLFAGSSASFVEDQEYLVDISGHQFICKAKVDDSSLPEPIIYLGNASLIDETVFENTKEVFCIAHVTYDNSRTLLTFGNTSGYNFFVGGFNYTLAIAKVISEFKTIDPVFLPEATATTKGAVFVDDVLNKDSKNAISNSAVFTQLDNKVDKVNGKGLSDVNFTKAYKSEVESIQELRNRINTLEQYNPNNADEADYEGMLQSAAMLATEIAANPFGAYLNVQELLGELMKLISGQTSDKVFMITPDSALILVKMSDKTPTKEDFKKGFSMVMGFLDTHFNFMTLTLGSGYIVPDISFDPDSWEMLGGDSVFEDVDEIGSFALSDAAIILQEGNSMGLPKGLYTLASSDMLIVGLEINGFNLNSSTAPVSQEQLGDISSILDSIIGEEVWTFTLEDGSTVDKVVISSD